LLLALSLAGCGKSGHQRLVDDANRICREGNQQIRALPSVTDRRSLASTADKQAAIIERARARLAKLGPPAADRRSFAQYLAALDVTVRTAKVIALAARAGKPPQVRALGAQAGRDILTVRRLARALGFRDCGRASR
jgi:hypothetical protein